MMKNIKQFSTGLLLALIVLPLSISAQVIYSTEGVILGYTNGSINLSDVEFRLLPTTKVILKKNKKGQLSNLNPGDNARISLIKIDKKRYVDTIEVIDALTPNEENLFRE